MSVPQVVIVGRPNVGKSSILNWLARARIAIVDDQAGVTRDRVTHLMSHEGRYFELVDTGGIGIVDTDNLAEHIERQIQVAIDAASLILFVVDTRDGLLPLDQRVADRIRSIGVSVICVANKADDERFDSQADEFYRFGFESLIRVSTLQNRGRDTLLGAVSAALPSDQGEEPIRDAEMKVAIVGRRNVGKSTFVNTLASAQRMIVSETPGTTRDSVDVRFELDGKAFIAIDTPGLRRAKSLTGDVDFYSMRRAQRSIRRADVVLVFFDSTQRISRVDKQLCDYVAEYYRPCIFVANKWDQLVGTMATSRWVTYLHDTFRTQRYVPIAFITGQTGKNVKALLNHAQMLHKQAGHRVGTGELNRTIQRALEQHAPPMQRTRPKVLYASQIGVRPPTIVMICNDPKSFTRPYQRYLLGVIRDAFPFQEIPIKLYFRKRGTEHSREGTGSIPDS